MTLQNVNVQSGHEGLDRGVASRIQAQTKWGMEAMAWIGYVLRALWPKPYLQPRFKVAARRSLY